MGERSGTDLPRFAAIQLRAQTIHDGHVVGITESLDEQKRARLVLASPVFQLKGTIGKINIDQDGAELGSSKLREQPIPRSWSPRSPTGLLFECQPQQASRYQFDSLDKLRVKRNVDSGLSPPAHPDLGRSWPQDRAPGQ